MSYLAAARRNMVDCQLRTFDVNDRAVLAAMEEIPRELFVPEGRETLAYFDQNLVLPGADDGRVMLAPMVLARLIQALAIEDDARVLDVAGGYGYSAALLASLGARVTMLESRQDLAEAAAGRLAKAGFAGRVATATGPLEAGAVGQGPFDAILINGAVETSPSALLEQLADGGRLACLQSDSRTCMARLFVRSGSATGYRTLFDASAPTLGAFRPAAAFVF